nr:DNA dependent RNA polymerase subunit Rpb2 [Mimivirus sp.]
MIFRGNSGLSLVQTQKGTVGFKIHRADLPFTKSGLIPDIIINPNCMPKRMTIGQLIECLLGKVCAIKGVYGDATPFTGVNINKINDDLVALGHEAWGNETMYNGMTGQRMEVKIFIGPTYYQRLKQMVGDKTHSRARGATQLLTRQPPEGKPQVCLSHNIKLWLVRRYASNTFKLREQLKILIKKFYSRINK